MTTTHDRQRIPAPRVPGTAPRHRARTPFRLAWRASLAGLVVAALVLSPALAGPAGAQTATQIRLGHFSPDTPEMDVYVVGFDGDEQRVLDGLGYGEVSDYAPLDPGEYTFLLRPAGSPADSDPAVTASAELEEGTAYTFAAMGPGAELRQALVMDDLVPPPAGQAKVRLIQASSTAGEVDAAVVDGPVLAEGVSFAETTGFAAVDADQWTVRVTSASGAGEAVGRVELAPGTVNTLIVLEGTDGRPFQLTAVVDATGMDVSSDDQAGPLGATAALPLGGVATGGGGTAVGDAGGRPGGLGTPVVAGIGLAAAAALAAGTGLVRGRLPRLQPAGGAWPARHRPRHMARPDRLRAGRRQP